MNRYSLLLRVVANDGVLRRIIGVLEFRGFRVVACHVDDMGDPTCHIRVDVVGERPSSLLCRQLARLHDVLEAAEESAAVKVASCS